MDSIIIIASGFVHFIFGPFALVFGSIVLLVNKGTQNHKRLGYIYLINLPGWHSFPFRIKNEWFTGHCEITTYQLDELLGTKLRALYQRRKGRDLFDLYYADQHNFRNLSIR